MRALGPGWLGRESSSTSRPCRSHELDSACASELETAGVRFAGTAREQRVERGGRPAQADRTGARRSEALGSQKCVPRVRVCAAEPSYRSRATGWAGSMGVSPIVTGPGAWRFPPSLRRTIGVGLSSRHQGGSVTGGARADRAWVALSRSVRSQQGARSLLRAGRGRFRSNVGCLSGRPSSREKGWPLVGQSPGS
jgi:hypothetical protein